MSDRWILSSSPHLHSGHSTTRIMGDVLIALIPAVIASFVLFGWRALVVETVCVASCMAAEYLSCRVMKKPNSTGDLSCMVTGLLLAMNLPVSIPLWQAVFGCVTSIVVAKMMFGGLGQNFVNPALVGRIVLTGSFPGDMNTWTHPFAWLGRAADGVSSATPLAMLKNGEIVAERYSIWDLLLGNRTGSLGETCALALILGGAYLLVRRVISPAIPLCFIGTVSVLALLCGENPVYHLLGGGLMIGAFFMATDYVTSPITTSGKILYAVGCGALTMLIRLGGSLPEGVSFAIVIMNITVPLIERITKPRPFGAERRVRR